MDISQIERSFYQTKAQGTSTTPLNDLRRVYYMAQGASGKFLDDLEKQWLRKIISDNGGTPQGSFLNDLWRQASSALGKGGSNSLTQNKIQVFLNL